MNGYRFWIVAALTLALTGPGGNQALADADSDVSSAGIVKEARAELGYRGLSLQDEPGLAREYDSLEASPFFNTSLFAERDGHHFSLDLAYLNDKDYAFDSHLNHKGKVLFNLRSERFFHNLEHIPYDNGYTSGLPAAVLPRVLTGVPAEGSRPDGYSPTSATPRVIYSDHDRGEDYGLRIDTNEAQLRINYPDYPAHFNLSYWRYEKSGEKQLRYLSEGSVQHNNVPPNSAAGDCTSCHMQSKTRDIDRVTDEIKAGIDAHAGYVDLAVEALYREFRDRESIPVDYFGAHGRGRLAGDYEHSEDPDSRVTELTLRANTAPAGGFVASGSFTAGQRKNLSDLKSVGPIEAETDYYKTAADVTYTPGSKWTVNLRYRLLDMDADNSDVLTAYGNDFIYTPGFAPGTGLEVRDSIDITRAWYEAVVNYRPFSNITVKGELRREDIERSGTGPFEEHHSNNGSPTEIKHDWEVPDSETITRVKLGFNSRWLERSALKVSGWALLKHSDDPAYGNSFEDGRELFLSGSYAPGTWGLLASLKILDEENTNRDYQQSDTTTFELDRRHRQQNVSLGAWTMPTEALTFDLNYGYLRTAIDQDLVFGAGEHNGNPLEPYYIQDDSVDYRQTVQTLTLGASWQASETVSCRLEGYQIRSKGDYSPEFSNIAPGGYYPNGTDADSSGLKDISRVDIRQQGLRGRLNWQMDKEWSCALEASYDDFDQRGDDVFDGSVQTTMVSLTRVW